MNLRERIGMDVGRKLSVERAIDWSANNSVRYLDVQIDLAPNALEDISGRASGIRAALERTGVELGLHTLSAVNIAEVSAGTTSCDAQRRLGSDDRLIRPSR